LNAKLRALIELVRPLNLLIILLTQVLFMAKGADWLNFGAADFLRSFNPSLLRWQDAFCLMLATAAAAAAGNVVNDIEGQAADAVNKPERRRVGTVISVRSAWIWYGILLLLSMGAAWMLDLTFFLFTLVVNLLLFFYSSDLKGMPPAGNMLVAMLTASVVFVARKGIEDASALPFSEFTMIAFLLNLAREWVKDVDDREGDERAGVRSMAVVYGSLRTLRFTAGVLCLAVVLIAAVALFYPAGMVFRVHLLLAAAGTGYMAFAVWQGNATGLASNRLKWLMLFGMLGVLWV
jgi:4-hydroxybenzoate polyprenyltransferase